MSKVLDATEASFDTEVLRNEKVVLVDFWANWCGPCRMMAPSLDALAYEQDAVCVVKVDIEANRSLAERYSIHSLPTLLLFKDGKEVKRMTGAKTRKALLAELSDYL